MRDLGAVRLRDLASAERLYQVQHARLRPDFPALRSLEAVPNNLPQQVTTFIGREREQREVKVALRKARLLTLSGIGGLGKTRLSLQVAADVIDDFPDGVWFVELAPITDERLVAHAAASVLGVKEEAGRPISEALVKHVRDAQLLLVLDNCEHLVAGMRATREAAAAGGRAGQDPGVEPRALQCRPGKRSIRCRRFRFLERPTGSPPSRFCNAKRCICSSNARWRCSRRSG